MPRERVTIPTEPTRGVCDGPHCGRPILWVMTVGGVRMPLDPDISPDGCVVPVTVPIAGGGTARRARVLTGDDLPALHPCWVPHHRTCPDSETYRRRQAAGAPKCRAGCGIPMDPWLPANGWRYHVLCAPLSDVRAHVEQARIERAQASLPGIGGAA